MQANYKKILLSTLLSMGFLNGTQKSTEMDYDTYKCNTTCSYYNGSFNYIDVDTLLPLPYPGLSIGRREKIGNMAFDASVGFHSIVLASDIAVNLKGLTYFADKQTYFGLGGTVYAANLCDVIYGGFSPLISFGKEYEKNFYEANFTCIRLVNRNLDFTPTLFLKYGIKF
jgi:hypothetical protein